MRRFGWISLFVVLLIVACGPPEVHDINGGPSVSDDDDAGDDDDDDDAATTFPTASGTTPPGGAPTLTQVPSFATWNSSVRPNMCSQCHTGASGGLTFGNQTDASSLKYFWFQSICNRAGGGTQAFNPPTGRFPRYMAGNTSGSPTGHPGITAANINAWMTAPGVMATPPSCNDFFDLANSN